MPVWDLRNQAIADKLSRSIVVDDPTGVHA